MTVSGPFQVLSFLNLDINALGWCVRSGNNRRDDGYRFHDVVHLAYAAILGWSPVTRALLDCKRRSSALSISKQKAFALVGSAILVQTALMKLGFTFGDSIAARRSSP